MLAVVLSRLSAFQIARVRVRLPIIVIFFIIKDCPLRALTLISLLVCLKVASNVRVSTAKFVLPAFDVKVLAKKT